VKQIEELQNKLPAYPAIQEREEYVHTAILVLLAFLNGEYHFIFQKRGPNIRQGGEICFPGGVYHRQDGTYEQAAVRETVEEMGIPAEKIKVIGPLDTMVAPLGIVVNAFVGIADIKDLNEIVPNRDEVEHVFSVPVSFFETHAPRKYEALLNVHPTVIDEATGREIVLFPARDLGLPEKYWKSWGGVKYVIHVYDVEQGPIWGITARFIVDIISKLKR